MIRLGIVGLGKMGLSHYAIANSTPGAQVVAVCDSSTLLLGFIDRYGRVNTYTSMPEMLAAERLDGVIISTPNHLHAEMVRTALAAGVAVFCEKPFTLSAHESIDLTELASANGLVTQVGYHYRYVATFQEMKHLIEGGALGKVTHAEAEAYGPVVVRPANATWRSKKSAGGGALYDYAPHPINLLTWLFGAPKTAIGTVMTSVFSADTEDEVLGTFQWPDSLSAHLSVSWSDTSERKMATKVSLWGAEGKIVADRQEIRVFLRHAAETSRRAYSAGWTTLNIAELTPPVAYYLRGEEYSLQMEDFVARVRNRALDGVNDFRSAATTDEAIELLTGANSGRQQEIEKVVAPRRRLWVRS
ncbi:Gfo/Idh/MocA family oxidoreductase [Amnibacterium sp. CER49]|uniref:Gfo/Idh/MocA family protein n=1 Tax=Amnibacterium sp. CER49 TaxID=3039161 RepID=UPI002449AD08|nr:Gfo/Idh/MocA family oxidoreductase [Amnibacterium sp. CER49]MDH2443008.1 Gfo/Idh/MocA family oxidoreductase [Amnibacterium sp. CER49]